MIRLDCPFCPDPCGLKHCAYNQEESVPKFSQRSKERLSTCHKDLQDIMEEVIKVRDITILCGHRSEEAQNKAFEEKKSKLRYPNSKHNSFPSRAVDIAPYPIDWNDKEAFHELAGIVKGIAHSKGIKIKWGGDFNSFFDGPHIELDDEE